MARWFLLSLWFIASAAPAQDGHPGAGVDTTFARFVCGMDAGMNTMMRDMHAPGYTGDANIDFLAMMIPHHEGAVEMARLVLIHGRDPLTRKLAEEIIASQIVEIEGMKQRLAILRANPVPAQDEFPALGGTRGSNP